MLIGDRCCRRRDRECSAPVVVSSAFQTGPTDGKRRESIVRRRQAVDLAVLGPQIGKIGLDPQSARNPPDHLVGRIFAAMPIEVLPQPSEQGGKLAMLDLVGYLGMRL